MPCVLPFGQSSFVLDFCAVNSVSRRKTSVCSVCVAKGETELFVLRWVCVKVQTIPFSLLWGDVSAALENHGGASPPESSASCPSLCLELQRSSVPVCLTEMLYLGCVSVLSGLHALPQQRTQHLCSLSMLYIDTPSLPLGIDNPTPWALQE